MRAAVMLVLVLLAPLAQAGSAEDPEVADADDDTNHPDGARDIVALWIEESETAVGPGFALHLQIAEDYDHTIGAFFAFYESYKVMFRTTGGMPDGAAQAYVDFRPSQDADAAGTAPVPVVDPESVACRMGFATEDDGWTGVSDEIRLEDEGNAEMLAGDHWVCHVSYDKFPGFDPAQHQITDLYVLHRWMVRGPLSGAGDVLPDTVARTHDRAPDDGFGRPWGLAVEVEAEAPPVNVTLPATIDVVGNGTNVTSTYALDTAPAHIGYVVNGTGVANVTLMDGNTAVWSCTCTGNMSGEWVHQGVGSNATVEQSATAEGNATADTPPGNWTLRIEQIAFKGTLVLDLRLQAPAVEVPEEHAPDEADDHGNETPLDTGTDKQSPGWPVTLGLVIAVVMGLRRREQV